jgi:hypothetical protein
MCYELEKPMETKLKLLDVIALTEDLPERGLRRGQVGTIVETLAPGVYEVEFCDDSGVAYASLAVQAKQMLLLCYQPAQAA